MAVILKNAFKKLQTLGPEMVEQVDQRLLAGDSAASVAAWLQDEVGAFSEMKRSSLCKSLERYRSADLKNKALEKVAGYHPRRTATGIMKRLSALDELENLVLIQRERFHKMYAMEHDKPMLLKTTSEEAKLLKEMLVELGKLQLETGVIQRAPKKVTGTLIDGTGEVKTFSWTEEQEKLYQELEGITYQEIEDVEEHRAAEDAEDVP